MQFTLAAFVKLSAFIATVNTVAVVALPEPVGLEARQSSTSCLLNLCTPGAANACSGCSPSGSASCTGVNILGIGVGICTPSICNVICTTTSQCCTNVANTTFACQLVPGQTIGACIPQVL